MYECLVHFIIELGYATYSFSGSIVFWVGSLVAGITAIYSFKLLSLTFFASPSGSRHDYEHIHEQPIIVIVPLAFLALIAIFFGFLAKDAFALGSDILSNSLFSHPNHTYVIEAEFSIPMHYKLLPLYAILSGSVIGILLYHVGIEHTLAFNLSSIGKSIYTFLNGKYLYDIVINQYVVISSFMLGGTTSKVLDRGAFELVGPFGLSNSIKNISENLNKFNSGNIVDYAIGIVIIIAIGSLFAFYPAISGFPIGDIRLIYAFLVSLYFYLITTTPSV